MRIRFTRGSRARAAAAALCGIAAIATAACSGPTPATAMAVRQPADASPAAVPVVVDCGASGQTRPGQYQLACASAGAMLTGLHWVSWGSSAAFASGASVVNDCVPSCVGGHGHSFPALVALWRAEPRPGHAGQLYFSRLTIIYTGSHSYNAGGTRHKLPATVTYPLSSSGGA
jgi:hypothetical protein